MRIVIKNPAPLGERLTKWGDYHFGKSLSEGLQRSNTSSEVISHYWPSWESEEDEEADLIIVLRGKRSYKPISKTPVFLWVLSHPATVTDIELEECSLILSASEIFKNYAESRCNTPVVLFRQCTDICNFKVEKPIFLPQSLNRKGIIFAANSRGYCREIVTRALDAGVTPSLIGSHWDAFGLQHLVLKDSVANSDLPSLYLHSYIGLNDHWGDMRHFGIINNRIFDYLACGLPVISDTFPELNEVFGDIVLPGNTAEEFKNSFDRCNREYETILRKIQSYQSIIKEHYSFDARAIELLRIYQENNFKSVTVHNRQSTAPVSKDLDTLYLFDKSIRSQQNNFRGKLRVLRVLAKKDVLESPNRLSQFSYFSAGFGEGPWQLVLDRSLRQLEGVIFDIIWFTSSETLNDIPELERNTFLEKLGESLSAKGCVAVPAIMMQSSWKKYLANRGLECTASISGWDLLSLGENVSCQQKNEELQNYAQFLEKKLSSMLSSRSWKIGNMLNNLFSTFNPSKIVKNRITKTHTLRRPDCLKGNDTLQKGRDK
jgi:hypothetical protein